MTVSSRRDTIVVLRGVSASSAASHGKINHDIYLSGGSQPIRTRIQCLQSSKLSAGVASCRSMGASRASRRGSSCARRENEAHVRHAPRREQGKPLVAHSGSYLGRKHPRPWPMRGTLRHTSAEVEGDDACPQTHIMVPSDSVDTPAMSSFTTRTRVESDSTLSPLLDDVLCHLRLSVDSDGKS